MAGSLPCLGMGTHFIHLKTYTSLLVQEDPRLLEEADFPLLSNLLE